MTDVNNNPTKPSNKPSHFIYQVRKGKDKEYWTRIGAAWPAKNTGEFNCQLDAVPLDGFFKLRLPIEKPE